MRSRACLASGDDCQQHPQGIEWNDQKRTVSGKERDRRSFGTRTACTPDTVHVILRVVWIVIIYDMGNVANILNSIVSKHRMVLFIPSLLGAFGQSHET